MRGNTIIQSKIALRPITLELVQKYPIWIQDQEVAKYLGTVVHVPDIDQEKSWYEQSASDPNSYVWQIEYEDKPIGTSSITGINWINRSGSTGTIIGEKDHWRKGIGTQTMIMRAYFAFDQLGLMSLHTEVIEGNEGSSRAMEKAGYEVVGTMPYRVFRAGEWSSATIKVLTAPRFQALHGKS